MPSLLLQALPVHKLSSAIDSEVLLARRADALWRKHCKAAGTLSAFGFSTSVLVKLTGGTA